MDQLELWILDNADKMNMNWTKYTWPQSWWPQISDYSCSIKFMNNTYIGRGTDLNDKISLIKSFSEAAERLVGQYNNLETSNGMSAHLTMELSKQNAEFELIERDIFLLHFYAQIPFTQFNDSEKYKIIQHYPFINKFIEMGIDFYFCKLIEEKEKIGVCVFAFGENYHIPWGMCFGSAVSSSLQMAFSKSLIECLRHLIPLISEECQQDLNLDEFNNLKHHDAEEHFKLGLNLDYADWFKKCFLKSSLQKVHLTQFSKQSSFVRLTTPAIFENLPLYFYSCHNSDAQDFKFGPTGSVNLERIDSFIRKNGHTYFDLNKMPHPIC